MTNNHYYTKDQVRELINDFEDLEEYLYGWDDAITANGMYKKAYVDMYVRHIS